MPLTPLSGPTVQFANVVGFDEQSAKKCGLPIISGVVKVVNSNGKSIFMRAKHLIYNAPSPHTLFSNYHMRELGIIMDDVSKRHLRDVETHGTHSIKFSNGHVIDLKTRCALPTFSVSKRTLEEYLNAPKDDIVDIVFEHWDRHTHHEDQLETTPPVNNAFTVTNALDLATTIVTFMSKLVDADKDLYAAFMVTKNI